MLSVVVVCHEKRVNISLYLPHALMDFNQCWVIDATWEPSFVDVVKGHIKVKGYLRSSCKIGWKCENGLIWKVEVQFEPSLIYWYNMWTFICSFSQSLCTKVKGHLKSSCKITWKCKFGLICILEDQLELPYCVKIILAIVNYFMDHVRDENK